MRTLLRHGMLAVALLLLAAATAADGLQLLEPQAHYYFYASRWMGTGLTLGLLSCAWYWSDPRFDPTLGHKGPGLHGALLFLFYGASWAVRKHDDRHLSSLAATLSGIGLLMLLLLLAEFVRQWRGQGRPHPGLTDTATTV